MAMWKLIKLLLFHKLDNSVLLNRYSNKGIFINFAGVLCNVLMLASLKEQPRERKDPVIWNRIFRAERNLWNNAENCMDCRRISSNDLIILCGDIIKAINA